jgi:hypothetical protein
MQCKKDYANADPELAESKVYDEVVIPTKELDDTAALEIWAY